MIPGRIVLIGFMGAGKTTVGKILADRVGYDMVDTDELIVVRAGAPIARIFAEQGEAAFRDIEAVVLRDIARRTGAVIATGGGAPFQEGNRGFFTRGCAVFHLRVTLAAARERTRRGAGRPLIGQEESALRRLYDARLPVYEELGTGVETEGRAPAEVAEQIMRLLGNPTTSRMPGGSDR